MSPSSQVDDSEGEAAGDDKGEDDRVALLVPLDLAWDAKGRQKNVPRTKFRMHYIRRRRRSSKRRIASHRT